MPMESGAARYKGRQLVVGPPAWTPAPPRRWNTRFSFGGLFLHGQLDSFSKRICPNCWDERMLKVSPAMLVNLFFPAHGIPAPRIASESPASFLRIHTLMPCISILCKHGYQSGISTVSHQGFVSPAFFMFTVARTR